MNREERTDINNAVQKLINANVRLAKVFADELNGLKEQLTRIEAKQNESLWKRFFKKKP